MSTYTVREGASVLLGSSSSCLAMPQDAKASRRTTSWSVSKPLALEVVVDLGAVAWPQDLATK